MANVKISELTALTPPAAADELAVVDTSASSTKKTTVGEVVGIITGDVEVANNGTATISELPVSKLQDGAARQLIQTDAAGTGVEWTSNIDLPGTLDVTSTATFDSIAQYPLGSAGAPTITFTGDTNTGIYSPGADQVAISTGALERARIDSSGRLGIGTSTPAAKLHVVTNPALVNQSGSVLFGENTNYGLEIRNVVDGAGFPRVEFRAPIAGNGEMLFFAGGSTERARIDSSGRLLVGTSSASGVNSNTALVLAGNFASFTGLASANDNTATTLFALENLNATYMVTAIITGSANAGAYHAVYIIGSVAANSHSIQALKAGSLLTLSLSGANVQATQSSGVTQTVTWSVTRMANF
jgi:hypothetical protein